MKLRWVPWIWDEVQTLEQDTFPFSLESGSSPHMSIVCLITQSHMGYGYMSLMIEHEVKKKKAFLTPTVQITYIQRMCQMSLAEMI